MVLEAPKVVDGLLALFDDRRAERIRRVDHDCAKTITGYITGNLLISMICGSLSYAVLAIMGVPYAGLIALFVGLADLIPLVGATLGRGHRHPGSVRGVHHRRHRGHHLLRALPAAGEPRPAAADLRPHGQGEPADRPDRHPHRGR